jgi:hypothetical protein
MRAKGPFTYGVESHAANVTSGNLVPGEPYIGSNGETYHVIRVATDGQPDSEPLQEHWKPGRYDLRCSACWLGYSHSRAAHRLSVARNR